MTKLFTVARLVPVECLDALDVFFSGFRVILDGDLGEYGPAAILRG